MTQGERVNKLRKKCGLTLEEFGKRLGVTKVAISNIENGNRKLTNQMTVSICREFNVNEIWLRTGEGGDDNMFTKVSEDDRYSLNLGRLSITENEFVKNGVNLLAETEPEKLKIIEEFMKEWLGIK